MPQRGNMRVKSCVRAVARPLSRPSTNGEMAEIASSSGSSSRTRSQTPIARSAPAHAHVYVQAEGVVAPGDVLQTVLDQAVVLGVDDLLVLPAAERVRADRTEQRRPGARRSRTACRGMTS